MNHHLDKLCQLMKVETTWYSLEGVEHRAAEETIHTILNAMKLDTSSDEAICEEIAKIEGKIWRKPLQEVNVFKKGSDNYNISVSVQEEFFHKDINWWIICEDGTKVTGSFKPAECEFLGEKLISNHKMMRVNLYLAETIANLDMGYHEFFISYSDDNLKLSDKSKIILAPHTSYVPDGFFEKKYWGLTAHAYTLKSNFHKLAADFSDLSKFIDYAIEKEADFVGINPLHAMHLQDPSIASPYSPSSRLQINPLYIALPYDEMYKEYNKYHDNAEENDGLIDYHKNLQVRLKILKQHYIEFNEQDEHRKGRSKFIKWAKVQDEEVIYFAIFNALAEHFNESDFHKWPAEYQTCKTNAVGVFAKNNTLSINFYLWLQWLANEQLHKLSQQAKSLPIGIYGDLAVGVTRSSADVWMDSRLIISNISFGSPPDAFAKSGQDWGICPFNPVYMQEKAFEPFIKLIRNNMKYFAALRIDHILGLNRLFWVAKSDEKQVQGTYVSNFYEEYLAIIALESHRNKCIVIGEDLGTLPHGMREQMDSQNILGYRVFWFEFWEESKLFKRPDTYFYKTLASVSTHDLPTIAGYLQDTDIKIKEELSAYYNEADIQFLTDYRRAEKDRLLAALEDQNLHVENKEDIVSINKNLYAFVAKSNSCLMSVQLDDLTMETKPLNLPGVPEHVYPNWRRKLSMTIEEIKNSDVAEQILATVKSYR